MYKHIPSTQAHMFKTFLEGMVNDCRLSDSEFGALLQEVEAPEDEDQRKINEAYIEAARGDCSDGHLEVDDEAIVSNGDDPGAYVQSWLWVSNSDLPKEIQVMLAYEPEDENPNDGQT